MRFEVEVTHVLINSRAERLFPFRYKVSGQCMCGEVFSVEQFTPVQAEYQLRAKVRFHMSRLRRNPDMWSTSHLIHYKGVKVMAQLANTTILFAHTGTGKDAQLGAVAAFRTVKDAKAYISFLKLAYNAGDATSVKTLWAKAPHDENGHLVTVNKFMVAEVPYAPVPDFADEPETM